MNKALSRSSSSTLQTKSQPQKKIGSKQKQYPDHILFHPVFTHSTPQRQGKIIDTDKQAMSAQPLSQSQGQMQNYPGINTSTTAAAAAELSVTGDGFITNSLKQQFAATNPSINKKNNENAISNDRSIAAAESHSAKHQIVVQLNAIIKSRSNNNSKDRYSINGVVGQQNRDMNDTPVKDIQYLESECKQKQHSQLEHIDQPNRLPSAQEMSNQFSHPRSSPNDHNQTPYLNNFNTDNNNNNNNNTTKGQNTVIMNSTSTTSQSIRQQLQQNLFSAASSSSSSNINKFAMFNKSLIPFPKKNKKNQKIINSSSASTANQAIITQCQSDSQVLPTQHYLITETSLSQQSQYLPNQGSCSKTTQKQQQQNKIQDSLKYFLGIQHNNNNNNNNNNHSLPPPPTSIIPLLKTLGAAIPGVLPMTNTAPTSSNSSQRHHPAASSATLKTYMDAREWDIQQQTQKQLLSQPTDDAVFTETVIAATAGTIQLGQEITPLPSKQNSKSNNNNTQGSNGSNSKDSRGSSKNNKRNNAKAESQQSAIQEEEDYFSKARIEEIHQQNQWKKRITAVDKAILEGDSDADEDHIQDTLQNAYTSKKSNLNQPQQTSPATVNSRDCQINLSYNSAQLHFEFATANRTSDWLVNYLIRRIYAYHIRVLKDSVETAKRILRTIIGFASSTSNIAVSYFFTQKNRSLAVFHHKCLHIQPLFDAATDLSKPLRYSDVALSDFHVIRCIGLGGFSRVYLVQKKDTAKMYALKLIDKQFIIDHKKEVIVSNERNIMMSVAHPFLLKLEYAFESESYIGFAMEYCAGGELFYHLRKIKRMQESMARFYFVEICLGIDYLHKRNIIYRDIKPENIFLDIDGHARIGDFGLAKPDMDANNRAYSFCGSPEYMAPEMLLKLGHTYTVDFYCLGALLYELVTGLPPFYSQDTDEIYKRILSEDLTFPASIPLTTECRDLLHGLLAKHPKSRLGSSNGIRDILAHPWFKPINIGDILEKRIEPMLKPSQLGFNFDEEEFNAGEEEFRRRLVDSQIEEDENNLHNIPMIFDDFYFDASLARLRKQLISQQQQSSSQHKQSLYQVRVQQEQKEQQQEQDIRLSNAEALKCPDIHSKNAELQHEQSNEQLSQAYSAEKKQHQPTKIAASVLHHGTYQPNQQQENSAMLSQGIASSSNANIIGSSQSVSLGGQLFTRTSPALNVQTAPNNNNTVMDIARQTKGSLSLEKLSNRIFATNARWNTEQSSQSPSSHKSSKKYPNALSLPSTSSSQSKSAAYLDQMQTLYKPKSCTTATHQYQPQSSLPFKHFKGKTANQGLFKSDNKSTITNTTNKSLIGLIMMSSPSDGKQQQQQQSSFLHRQPSAKANSSNSYGIVSNTNNALTSTNRSTSSSSSKNKQDSRVSSSSFNNFLANKIISINNGHSTSSSSGYLNYGKTLLAGNQQVAAASVAQEKSEEKIVLHGEQMQGTKNASNRIIALGNSSALKRLKTDDPAMINSSSSSSTLPAEFITNKQYPTMAVYSNDHLPLSQQQQQQQPENMADKSRDVPQLTGIVSDINRRSRVLMKANSHTNINKPSKSSYSLSLASHNHHHNHQSHSQQHSMKQFSNNTNNNSNNIANTISTTTATSSSQSSSSSTKHVNHSLSSILSMQQKQQPLLSHQRNTLIGAGSLCQAQHQLSMQSQSTTQKHYNPLDFIAQRTAKY